MLRAHGWTEVHLGAAPRRRRPPSSRLADPAAALANEGSSVAKRHTNCLGRIDERTLNRLRDGGKVGHHGLMEPAIVVEIEAQSVYGAPESPTSSDS